MLNRISLDPSHFHINTHHSHYDLLWCDGSQKTPWSFYACWKSKTLYSCWQGKGASMNQCLQSFANCEIWLPLVSNSPCQQISPSWSLRIDFAASKSNLPAFTLHKCWTRASLDKGEIEPVFSSGENNSKKLNSSSLWSPSPWLVAFICLLSPTFG